MTSREQRINRIGTTAILALIAGGLTFAAFRSEGFRATKVKLHDAGIWLTKSDVIGRLNHQLQSVDTQSATFGTELQLQQDDSTVIVTSQNPPVIHRYDVALNAVVGDPKGTRLPTDAQVSIGGDRGGLLDPATGNLWYTSGESVSVVKIEENTDFVALKDATKLVVGRDGIAHVFAPKTGELWTFKDIFKKADGPTTGTQSSPTSAVSPSSTVPVVSKPKVVKNVGGELPMTTAGDRVVFLDTDRGSVIVDDGTVIPVPGVDANAKLQQPSADRGHVIVATAKSLMLIDLGSKAVKTMGKDGVADAGGNGSALSPVWLNGCAYGAWQSQAVRFCGPGVKSEVQAFAQPTEIPWQLRTNHGFVALNFVSGAAVDLSDDGPIRPMINSTWSDALAPELKAKQQTQTEITEQVNTCNFDPTKANTPPIAVADSFGVRRDDPTILDVLSGVASEGNKADQDPDCDALTVALPQKLADAGGLLPGDGGTLSVIKNGRALQYSPPSADKHPAGPITFSYELSDGRTVPPVTANVTVAFVEAKQNTPPVPHDDATSVAQGKSAQLNVLANDFDPDGDPLVVTSAAILDAQGTAVGVNGIEGDSLIWQANGRVSYRASAGAIKSGRIGYEVSDGRGGVGKAVIEVSVIPGGTGQNKPPNTTNDSLIGVAGQNLAVDVTLNDSDPNDDVLALTKLVPIDAKTPDIAKWGDTGKGGVVALDNAQEGVYDYAYQVNDGNGGSAWGRVRFSVLKAGQNHAPVAVRDDAVVSQGRSTLIDVLGNDTDIDGDVMMITATKPGSVADGLVSSDALSVEVLDHRILRVRTKSAAEALQTYKFQYTISDGQASSSAVVTVRVAAAGPGQAPVTKHDDARVHLGGAVAIPVLSNDYDPDGDPITITPGSAKIVSPDGTDQGQLFVEGDLVVYVAPSVAARDRGFTLNAVYQISDGQHPEQETIQISVVDLTENQAPAPNDILLRVYTKQQNVKIPLPRFGLDPDGDPVEIGSQIPDPTRAQRGEGNYDAKKAVFTYNAGSEPGSDAFSFEVRDSPALGESKTGHITVRVTIAVPGENAPPVAVDDLFEARAGQTAAFPVLGNDTDPDGDPISFAPSQPVDAPASSAGAAAGTPSVSAADKNRVIFSANALASGATKATSDFTYRIVDDQGHGASASVHVDITADGPANRPPVAKDDPQPPAAQGQIVLVDVLANDNDPEGDPLSVQCPPVSDAYCKRVDDVKSADGKTRQGLQVTMGTTSLSFGYLLSDPAHPDEATGATRAVVQVPFKAAAKDLPPKCEPLSLDLSPTDPNPFTVAIDLAKQCSDPDQGDQIGISPQSKPHVARGQAGLTTTDLSWNQTSFSFERVPTFSGEVAFTYSVEDKAHAAAVGSIVIKIVGKVNNPPVVTDVLRDVEAGAPEVTISLSGSAVKDPDPGDDQLLVFGGAASPDAKYLTTSITREGVLTVAAPDGKVVTDETGPKTLKVPYTVSDTHGGDVTGAVTITVRPSNKPGPKAVADAISPAVKQGASGTINVLANDLPGDPLFPNLKVTTPTVQATSNTGPAGTATIDPNGNAVFTPTPGFHGTAVFSYTIQDDRHSPNKQGTATVTVDVQAKPDKPASPSWGAQQSKTAEVTFTNTPDNGALITSYVVSWNGGKKDCGPAAGSCLITGLTNGVAYQFQVTAINAVGPSDPSDPSQPYTPDQVPDQPNQPTAEWGDRSATVTWANVSNPGSPLTGVRIDVSPADVPPCQGTVAASGSCPFTGLTNGTPYTFTVTATNSSKPTGSSKPSAPSQPVTPAGDPGKVGKPTLVEGDGFVDASWGAVSPNGDPAGLTYTVKLLNNGVAEQTVGPMTATSKRIQATNGKVYKVVVEANNKYTARTKVPVVSVESDPITPSGRPLAPGSLGVTQNQDGAVQMSIGATDNNGAPLDYYTVSASNGSSKQFPAAATGTATSIVYPGLTNGTAYTFTITAHNKNGDGVSASGGNSGTPFGTPQAPTVTCGNNGSFITCSWAISGLNGPAPAATTVNVDGGTGQVSTAASGTWTSASLPYSTTRIMTVQVCNNGAAVAPGGPANPCKTATGQATSAPQPTPIVSCSASGTSVQCSWSTPGLLASDPHTTRAFINGGLVSANDSGTWGPNNVGYSSTQTMDVTLCNSSGECITRSANATTAAPPAPTLFVSSSSSIAIANCTPNSCNYVNVTGNNFGSGASVTYSCFSSNAIPSSQNGQFSPPASRTVTANPSGSFSDNFYYTAYVSDVNCTAGSVNSNSVHMH